MVSVEPWLKALLPLTFLFPSPPPKLQTGCPCHTQSPSTQDYDETIKLAQQHVTDARSEIQKRMDEHNMSIKDMIDMEIGAKFLKAQLKIMNDGEALFSRCRGFNRDLGRVSASSGFQAVKKGNIDMALDWPLIKV
ncbi:hypothetical protein FQN57_006769 [Myotisia sp. PD_48]|nr:hypothetical protein FQN57_006769 [Myotisia sp. PD_48]